MTNYVFDIYKSFDESDLNDEIILDEGEIRSFEGKTFKATIIIKDLEEMVIDEEE